MGDDVVISLTPIKANIPRPFPCNDVGDVVPHAVLFARGIGISLPRKKEAVSK